MKSIENHQQQTLQNAGLFTSKPYPQGHVLEFGVIVGKPTTTGVPSPAQGDFTNEWSSEDEALAYFQKYYFRSLDTTLLQ